jgi:hypothetical protein
VALAFPFEYKSTRDAKVVSNLLVVVAKNIPTQDRIERLWVEIAADRMEQKIYHTAYAAIQKVSSCVTISSISFVCEQWSR